MSIVTKLSIIGTAALAALVLGAGRTDAARHRPFTIPSYGSVVAHARVPNLRVYARPGATKPIRVLRNPNAEGGQLVVLVLWQQRRWTWPAWVRVALPVRPNGSSGWVRSSDVTFLLDPFSVKVELVRHRITVWKKGKVFLRTAVGVGRGVTPTPRGRYYIVELIKTHDPRGLYGPYAFGTSAFSNVLFSFGGGPGQIGIHGTNYPQGLGTNVSHGCIRMANWAITRLAKSVPLGTPVVIAS